MSDTNVAASTDELQISLTSLATGTQPTVSPSTLNVTAGDTVQITVTWPKSENPTATGWLNFNATSQDPFNEIVGGSTEFQIIPANPGNSKNTYSGQTSLIIDPASYNGNDTYCLVLQIDGENYSVDPVIVLTGGSNPP